MREILFRGKQTDKDKWVYGVPTKGNRYDESEILMIERVFDCDEYACKGCEFTPVIPETVGQYTGLTDKNGERIFEGDMIIELDGGMDGIPRKVVWDEYWMQFECPLVRRHRAYGINSGRLWLMRDRDIEVIGNIHDNPELIGGDSDA